MSSQIPPDDVEFAYRRRGNQVRVVAKGDPNEIRAVLIGVWADWTPAARLEFVAELAHYAKVLTFPDQFPDDFLPRLSEVVRKAMGKEAGFDVGRAKRLEHGEET